MKNSEQLPGYAHSSNIGSEISGGGRKKKKENYHQGIYLLWI